MKTKGGTGMGVLPIPDEIRQMVGAINQLVKSVEAQNVLLAKIQSQMGTFMSNSG